MARRYDSSTTTFSPEGRLHQVGGEQGQCTRTLAKTIILSVIVCGLLIRRYSCRAVAVLVRVLNRIVRSMILEREAGSLCVCVCATNGMEQERAGRRWCPPCKLVLLSECCRDDLWVTTAAALEHEQMHAPHFYCRVLT